MKKNLPILVQYTKEFTQVSGIRIILLPIYSIILGVTQGIGILMLIPLINFLGMTGISHSNSTNSISKIFIVFFKYTKLPMTITSILILYLILIVIVKYVQYQQNILSTTLRNNYIRNIQARLFKSVIFAEWQYISNQKASNITHIITTDLPIISNGTYCFLKVLVTSIISIVYLGLALFISSELTLFTILFAVVSFFFLKKYLPDSLITGIFVRNARANIYALLLDHVNGLKIAKSYCAENREYLKFKSIAEDIAVRETKTIMLNSKISLNYSLISNFLLCAVIYTALTTFSIPLSSIILLMVIFSKLFPNISSSLGDFQRLYSMTPSFSAANDLYRQALSHQENLTEECKNNIPLLKDSIEFKNISFSYSADAGNFQIKNFNISIPAGSTTVIAGESGSGKSTFADLITGLLKADTGEILIDGIPICKDNLLSWKKQIGYLPQEIFLFHDTIRNNILWGKPNASETEILESLKLASAYDFVMNMPDGLDTVVKDRGLRLSGGEKQRIALARTLIRKPSLLILDEATSSLDHQNEENIYSAIKELKHTLTIIIIAHRISAISFADRILTFNNG